MRNRRTTFVSSLVSSIHGPMVLLARGGKNSRLETWRRGCSSFLVSLIMGPPLLSLAPALEAKAVNSGRGASLPSGRAISEEESRTRSQSDMHWDPDEQSLHRNGQLFCCTVHSARGVETSEHRRRGLHHSLIQTSSFRSEGGLSSTGLRQPTAAEKQLSICMPQSQPGWWAAAVRRGLLQLEQSGRVGRSEANANAWDEGGEGG
jgi:hypothetical protein